MDALDTAPAVPCCPLAWRVGRGLLGTTYRCRAHGETFVAHKPYVPPTLDEVAQWVAWADASVNASERLGS